MKTNSNIYGTFGLGCCYSTFHALIIFLNPMRKVFSQLIYGVGTLITHFMDEEMEAWKGRVKVLNHTKPAGGRAKTQTQPM